LRDWCNSRAMTGALRIRCVSVGFDKFWLWYVDKSTVPVLTITCVEVWTLINCTQTTCMMTIFFIGFGPEMDIFHFYFTYISYNFCEVSQAIKMACASDFNGGSPCRQIHHCTHHRLPEASARRPALPAPANLDFPSETLLPILCDPTGSTAL